MTGHAHDCAPTCSPRLDGAQVLADHIATCRPDIDATIVMHAGSADDVLTQMIASGEWVLDGETEYVAGKRIRTVRRTTVSDTATLRSAGGTVTA